MYGVSNMKALSREFLIETINKLESEKSKQRKIITLQKDTIMNLRKTAKERTVRIKELTQGV